MLAPFLFDSIVILGGSGYVGSNLVRELKGVGVKVQSPASTEIDLTSESSVEKLVQSFHPNTAIVFSACISPIAALHQEHFLAMSAWHMFYRRQSRNMRPHTLYT